MARPGVEITSRAARAARGEPTDTGVAFVVGITDKGRNDEPVLIHSMADLISEYGERTAAGQLHDAMELAFSEGLADAWVSRVVGPAPVRASLILDDRAGAPLDTAEVHALDVGAYANGAAEGGLAIEVQNGTDANTWRLVIHQRQADGTYDEVERHDNLTMDPALDSYAPTVVGGITAGGVITRGASDYVLVEDLASATASPNDNPVVLARTNLAGGTDDHANAVDAQWLAALNLFDTDLGPGQVAAPGRTTVAAHQQLIDHGAARFRSPVLDTGDAASEATMDAAAAAVDDYAGSDWAALFGGWVTVPGVAGSSVRRVPPSGLVLGLVARLDAQLGGAGFAAAGPQGTARYALDVILPAGGLEEDDYESLNAAGVNMVRAFRASGVQLHGFRSVSSDPEWVQWSSSRERMSLHARLNRIGQGYKFRTIDGRGQLFSELNGALKGECMRDYNLGLLYGDTPEEAFRVDTGDTVNTDDTTAAGMILAEVYARFAPFAELVRFAVVKVPITGRV